jgi:hypothetical protein
MVVGNTAVGGQGGHASGAGLPGGSGLGGGIDSSGTLIIRQSAILSNSAVGGTGGNGARGFMSNGLDARYGGNGYGGGVSSHSNAFSATIINSTIAGNRAAGGSGGNGGDGGSSGVLGFDGGKGGDGGYGTGGGIRVASPVTLDNSTVAANIAAGGNPGSGGAGGPGFPFRGTAGDPGAVGTAGGGGIDVYVDVIGPTPSPFSSISSIIAQNSIAGGTSVDVFGAFAAAANSLVGDATGATGFVAGVAGNLAGLNPQLGPLKDNGGPTPTMALLPGSPAIDAGSNPLGLSADGRGYKTRAVGAGPDIGAFESGATAPATNPGGGGKPFVSPIKVTIVRFKGRKQVRVTDPATGAVKFVVYPFGKAYRGNFQVQTGDVDGDGVADVIARRPLPHKKFATKVFSGVNGKPISIKMS